MIDFYSLTALDIALFSVFILLFIIQLIFIFGFSLKLIRLKKCQENAPENQISVLLPLRNEEGRIKSILEKIFGQDYSAFEAVVVDDYSLDDTLTILGVLAKTYNKLKFSSLSQETRYSEKLAINIGLKGANSNWVLRINQESETIPGTWLSHFNRYIDQQTDAVVGYSNIIPRKGFRNKIYRIEHFLQFSSSATFILNGLPFVYHENNILFRKELYFDGPGFRHKINKNFANLELVFNDRFKKGRTKLAISPENTLREQVEVTGEMVRELIKKGLKIRKNLSFGKRFLMMTDEYSRLFFYAMLGVLLFFRLEYWVWYSSIALIYTILFCIIVKKTTSRLNERKIFLSSLVYTLFKPLINTWFLWSMRLTIRRNRWN